MRYADGQVRAVESYELLEPPWYERARTYEDAFSPDPRVRAGKAQWRIVIGRWKAWAYEPPADTQVSDELVKRLADEAERGYGPEQLRAAVAAGPATP